MDFLSALISVVFFYSKMKVFFHHAKRTNYCFVEFFFLALVTECKMDSRAQLNSCCVIQAFPGKRTLLFSIPHQK